MNQLMQFRHRGLLRIALPLACIFLSSAALADSSAGLPLAPGASYSAKLDGQDFIATWVSSSYSSMGGKQVLNVTGHVGEGLDGRFFNCNFVEPKVGSVALGGSGFVRTGCTYHGGGTDFMESDYSMESGSIEITALDAAANTVSGNFTLSGRNHARTRALNVTDGHFVKIPIGTPSRLK